LPLSFGPERTQRTAADRLGGFVPRAYHFARQKSQSLACGNVCFRPIPATAPG